MGAAEKLRGILFKWMMREARREKLRWMKDEPFLRLQFYLKLGRRLNLKNPELYDDKLQWIKLHDRKEIYHTFVDKIAVRDYVREKAGEKYLIPALYELDRPEQIPWEDLPDRFVIKCTHGSSCNIICRDKSKLDIAKAKEDLAYWMRRDWFDLSREWPYRGVKPRILIEHYLEGDTGDVPYDYKIMCFNGRPTYIVVDADRYIRHTRNYYDTNWVKQDMFNRHPNIDREIERPKELEEMLSVAEKLCQGLRHIRIDLYTVKGKVYFGEMTFFHGYGMEVFRPRSFEKHMGDLIPLDETV